MIVLVGEREREGGGREREREREGGEEEEEGWCMDEIIKRSVLSVGVCRVLSCIVVSSK